MKKEWTEQDLRAFAENAQTAFEDVTLTEADEEAADTWQDDGLQVDYVLRNGQVDCVLRRLIEADGKLWQLQMTAPLAGSDLPEDRMTARERELCRDVGTESAGVPGVSGFPRLSRVRVMPTVSKAASAQTTQTRTACRCSDVIDCLSD